MGSIPMKIKLKIELFKVIKVSGIAFLVSCGSNGSKSLKPNLGPSGIIPNSTNPQDEDAQGDTGEEGDQDIDGDGIPDQPSSANDGDVSNNPGDGSMDPNMPSDGSKPKEPDIQKIFPKTGIRNFAQINATMSTLTGVPTTNAQVTAFYNAQATSLPTDNDVKGFIGSQQVAVFKLAVEYCDVLVKDTTLRTSIFGNFNFAAAPNVAFATDAKNALADALVTKFWGKNLSTLSPHSENVTMVVTLIDELLNGRDLTVATQTPGIATGTCAGVLSSAPVTLY
jgi:hypothetical protein